MQERNKAGSGGYYKKMIIALVAIIFIIAIISLIQSNFQILGEPGGEIGGVREFGGGGLGGGHVSGCENDFECGIGETCDRCGTCETGFCSKTKDGILQCLCDPTYRTYTPCPSGSCNICCGRG